MKARRAPYTWELYMARFVVTICAIRMAGEGIPAAQAMMGW